MKKTYLLFLYIICSLLIFGCESDNNDSDENYIIETLGTVSRVTHYGLQSGDLSFYDLTDNKRIVYTTKTTSYRVREYNSGWEKINNKDIFIGDFLVIKYKSNDVDYSVKPNVFRASHIDVYPNGFNISNNVTYIIINTNSVHNN
jgi:hypothetical protein